MKNQNIFLLCLIAIFLNSAQLLAQQRTYCNPINLDYGYCPIPNFTEAGKHRATADPVIVDYKGDYFLFSTNQMGYWWSHDLNHWKFVSRSFLKPIHHVYDDLCAPAVWIMGDTMLVYGSTVSKDFPIWMSTNPKVDDWKEAVDSFKIGAWDPDFFRDEDGKLYLYYGSSNKYPLYGVGVDPKTFQPTGDPKELLYLDDKRFGWQRFGEYADNTFLDPFIEGSWMTKYKGKYYLQYGAPGTEMSGYADGVAVADHPLGPFVHQSTPLSYKPGGFARGAGHGATFTDHWGNFWHVSTMVISVKNNFERRIGIWPAGFDKDGTIYCNTAFGDYPHYLPNGEADHLKSRFTGWMLLNYNKPVTVSSTYGGYHANFAVDENIKTYWSAKTVNSGEWLISDMGETSMVHSIQINYADQDATLMGKQHNIFHQYKLYASIDGKSWKLIVDKSKNHQDVPHDYLELAHPVQARYIKLENIHVPDGKFAISGFRLFGYGNGTKPNPVNGLTILRTANDKRSAWIKWTASDDAFGYNIYFGTDPDKLYNCMMVYGSNEYWFKGMDKDATYYYTIEAFNENGISDISKVVKSE